MDLGITLTTQSHTVTSANEVTVFNFPKIMKPKKITFLQLCYLSKVVDLFDVDGYKFTPYLNASDDMGAHYGPADDAHMWFETDDLEIILRDDGITIVDQDPNDEERDLVLNFAFPAEFVIGHDPAVKQPDLDEAVYMTFDSSTGRSDKYVGAYTGLGVWTNQAYRHGTPLRWFPIWEVVRDKALNLTVNE